jgi:hypothetical protein
MRAIVIGVPTPHQWNFRGRPAAARSGRGDPVVRRRWAVGTATAGIVAAVGMPSGLLWWLIAPRPDVTAIGDGTTAPFPVSETNFAVDGWFAVIMMVVGIATGYGAFLVQYRLAARDRTDLRLACLLGTAAGACVGAVIAWRLGVLLDAAEFQRALDAAAPGEVIRSGLRLNALSALAAWPFVAVLQYGLFDAVSMWRRDLPAERAADTTDEESHAAPASAPYGADPESYGAHPGSYGVDSEPYGAHPAPPAAPPAPDGRDTRAEPGSGL